jgi:uroporphyrinogen-III synthase
MKPLVIARPEPGNSQTAATARAEGLTIVAAPLFAFESVPWNYDNSISYDGLLITSANSILQAKDLPKDLRRLPVYAVGPATARAAQQAGFADIRIGPGNGQDVVAMAAVQGAQRLLHLAGDPHRPLHHPALTLDVQIVYRTVDLPPAPNLITALSGPCVVLAHSPRMADRLRRIATARHQIDLIAISAQAAKAAGPGWQSVHWPDTPSATAMLACALPLCRGAVPGKTAG